MNLCRYFLALLVVLPLCGPLRAQEPDAEGQFYLGFAGSAVFPYAPQVQLGLGGRGDDFKAGAGITAAFGYAFKEGFSTEFEWGHQKVGIGNPAVVPVVRPYLSVSPGDPAGGPVARPYLSVSPINPLESDREIKTQSLMGNVYYRYPKWRVSPYAGFGLGAFFHDDTVTTTGIFFANAPPGLATTDFFFGFPTSPSRTTAVYEDSRFAYQLMVGLSVGASQRVELRIGYRFRSSRGAPIDADQIEAGIRFRL